MPPGQGSVKQGAQSREPEAIDRARTGRLFDHHSSASGKNQYSYQASFLSCVVTELSGNDALFWIHAARISGAALLISPNQAVDH